MHGAVLRMQGSARMLHAGMAGNCSLTMATYFCAVTTHTFSGGQMPLKRSAVS